MKKPRTRVQKTNAVIYCRVSTEEQVENLSLSTQEQRCIGYCSQKGWPILRIFREEGESAKTSQRTEFQEMLRFCNDQKNGVGFVVFNDLSRFSRTSEDSILIRAQLLSAGIFIRSVTETIDETSTGNFMTNVFAAVHQLDNDRKAERTKIGMLAAAAAGRWPFKAPLGYQNVIGARQGPNIVPDKNTAALVKKAFELFATGLQSKAEVLRVLTSDGLRTAKGKPLSPQTFQKMMENPIYAGWVVYPKRGMPSAGAFSHW